MRAVASPPKSRLPESAPTAARLDHQAAGFVQHWIGVALGTMTRCVTTVTGSHRAALPNRAVFRSRRRLRRRRPGLVRITRAMAVPASPVAVVSWHPPRWRHNVAVVAGGDLLDDLCRQLMHLDVGCAATSGAASQTPHRTAPLLVHDDAHGGMASRAARSLGG